MRHLLLLLSLVLLLAGCSEFNRALKSTDAAYKMQVAEKYYNNGGYDRAIPLLEELVMIQRGRAEAERVNYMYAKAYYLMKDYTLGGYYLSNFVRTFPSSQYAEECAFLTAMCSYRNSPEYELDQGETRMAIDQLQLFLVRYPATSLKDSCNNLIDALRDKLELKAWKAAYQYYHMRNYQAASVTFKNFLREWPNTKFREDALWLTLRADHALAQNSVESRKRERIQEAIRSFRNFADAFPQSGLLPDAEKLHRELQAMQEGASTQEGTRP